MESPPPPVSGASTVGKYYSSAAGPASPDAYVPDAGGHPFAATEPVRDSTSRPRRVGGYGAALALDSGHETLFRYGTATSTQLHKLFGRNVGLASYYERILQIDPNGQDHIAYVDRAGKTIATGLAGDHPEILKSVAPPSSGPISYRLDENNAIDAQLGISRSVSSFVVIGTQKLLFNYDLKGVEYSIPGDSRFPAICESCQYTLKIKITDQKGHAVPLCKQSAPTDLSHADCSCSDPNEIDESLPKPPVPQNICRPGDPITDQTTTLATTPNSPIQFCANLTDGEYEVVKELMVNEDGLAAILTSDIAGSDFVAANASVPPTTDKDRMCGQACKSFCAEASNDASRTSNSYNSCLQSCQNPQIWAFGAAATRSCDALQSELDRDFEPNGILAGQSKPHHEQCRVDVCRKRNDPAGDQDPKRSSDAFDDRMMAVDSYNDALACGYLDPLGGTSGAPVISGTCSNGVIDHDPVFDGGAYAERARPSMVAVMGDFTDNMPGFPAAGSTIGPTGGLCPSPAFLGKNIWDMAKDSSFYADANNPCGRTPSDDERWHMFRSLYLDAKQTTLEAFTVAPGGGNCPYWNDPHAHFKPFTFNSIQDVATEAQTLTDSYGRAFCPLRTAQWLIQLEQSCPPLAGSPSKASIFADLAQFCMTSARSGNFLATLTTTAIASDPNLKDAIQQLAAVSNQCSLGSIATAAPFLTEMNLCPPAVAGQRSGGLSSASSALFSAKPNSALSFFAQCHNTFSSVNPAFVATAPSTDQRLLVCQSAINDLAAQQSKIALAQATQQFKTFEQQSYHSRCLGSQMQESFSYQFAPNEYHYTLYYYDQAGDLVETVPPAGVHPLSNSDAASLDADPGKALLPNHGVISRYQYNSVGQVIFQETPDASWKRFWYDDAGQLRFSQTAQQQADKRYAYVKYDLRGRITETGLVAGVPDVSTIMTAAVAAGRPIAEDAAREFLDKLLRGFANLAIFPDPAQLSQFATEQVIATTYDHPAAVCTALAAQNLRGRISGISAQSSIGNANTCYNYDPHGNISSLLQKVPGLGDKRIDYDYDILDGKILAAHYQGGLSDQLHHRYTYDSDRRLWTVKTSRDGELWERDAAYTYYRHGPLARVELGADRVQGLDYLYAITGWPKGINSNSLDAIRDPGGDGRAGGANIAVARDAFGSAIHYFPGDYTAVSSGAVASVAPPQLAYTSISGTEVTSSALAQASCPAASTPAKCGLYDGNVTATVQSVGAFGAKTLGTAYQYDQLYRLRASTPFTDPTLASPNPAIPSYTWPAASNDPNLWRTDVSYDENGNITALNRHAPDPTGASATGQSMDALTYRYPLDAQGDIINNRLLHINDSALTGLYPDDLDDQGTPYDPANANYTYDLSGRLTRDRAAGLNAITWNATNRVATIERTDDVLEFVYDGLGNRIAKITRAGLDSTKWHYEYFVRDEKGKILATYKKDPSVTGGSAPSIALEDQTIFGASRLGTWAPADPPWAPITLGSSSGGISIGSVSSPGSTTLTPAPVLRRYARVRGAKQYELANYLGNVFATIKDRKKEIPFGTDPSAPSAITHYEAEVVNATDYDPFGSPLFGRNQAGAGARVYRYGFSGLERDDDIKGAGNSYYTNARLFDPRVGRWLSPDPVEVAASSPFVGFGNNPIRYADPKGTLLDIPGDRFTPNSTPEPKESAGTDDESTPQSHSSRKYSFGLGLKNEGLGFKDTPFADSKQSALPSATGSNANFGLDRNFRVDLRSPPLPEPRPDAFDFDYQLANAKIPETERDIHLESQFGVGANVTGKTIAPTVGQQVSVVPGGVSANSFDLPGGANLSVLHEPNVSLSGSTPGSPGPMLGAGIDLLNLSRGKTEVALGAGFSGSTPNISLGAKHDIGFEQKLRFFWQGQIDATGGVSVTGGIVVNPGSLLGNKKD